MYMLTEFEASCSKRYLEHFIKTSNLYVYAEYIITLIHSYVLL